MTSQPYLDLYEGTGRTLKQRKMDLPDHRRFAGEENPEKYIASEGLKHAVNVALYLGQPLLVTGDPGTGKTRLAGSIAWEFGLPEPLEFHTKTTSAASDLFYSYDAIRRFQDAHGNTPKELHEYITCHALGIAILLTRSRSDIENRILPPKYRNLPPTRSVVLIDEIDKAPRDFPNDLLQEIEHMQFRIKESDWQPFEAEPALKPILILTSNSEKNLPDAFLRRCVFYHIPFPDRDTLKKIIEKRFSDDPDFKPFMTGGQLDSALRHFEQIRDLNLKKTPATAECISWISILKALNIDMGTIRNDIMKKIERSYSALAKNRQDMDRMRQFLADSCSRAS